VLGGDTGGDVGGNAGGAAGGTAGGALPLPGALVGAPDELVESVPPQAHSSAMQPAINVHCHDLYMPHSEGVVFGESHFENHQHHGLG
jgi:hypothetical protein